MVAHIVVTDAPYYGLTGEDGHIGIGGIETGQYVVSVWHPRLRAGADPLAQNGEGMRIGSLTHTLLQYLPDVPPAAREAAALRFLAVRAGDYDEARRQALARRALAVLDNPALAAIFGPGSRASQP